MKYTIELTEKQANRINDIMIGLNTSWGYPNIPKLKPNIPIPMKESPAYKKGFEDGNQIADKDLKAIRLSTYDMAYNKGLEDLVHAIEVYLPLNSEERLDYFGTNIPISQYAIESPKDLIAMAKAYEEKKKAEEEKKAEEDTIKVGDEVKSICGGLVGVVTRVNQSTGRFRILFSDGSGGMTEIFPEDYEKTGRHFVQIAEVLEKLGGEENDNNGFDKAITGK